MGEEAEISRVLIHHGERADGGSERIWRPDPPKYPTQGKNRV
jgi:hypothetical protein